MGNRRPFHAYHATSKKRSEKIGFLYPELEVAQPFDGGFSAGVSFSSELYLCALMRTIFPKDFP